MGFRYRLRNEAGDDLGTAEYSYEPAPGDEIHIDGNQRALVRAVAPVERMQQPGPRPLYGTLEIEPVDKT